MTTFPLHMAILGNASGDYGALNSGEYGVEKALRMHIQAQLRDTQKYCGRRDWVKKLDEKFDEEGFRIRYHRVEFRCREDRETANSLLSFVPMDYDYSKGENYEVFYDLLEPTLSEELDSADDEEEDGSEDESDASDDAIDAMEESKVKTSSA